MPTYRKCEVLTIRGEGQLLPLRDVGASNSLERREVTTWYYQM